MTINKWILHPPSTVIPLPMGTKMLHVDEQHGQMCVWTDATWASELAPMVRHRFIPVPTGDRSPAATYLGTAKVLGALGETLVWHIFVTIELPDSRDDPADQEITTDIMKFYADRTLAEGPR